MTDKPGEKPNLENQLAEMMQFKWWQHGGDPVPPWIKTIMDKGDLMKMAIGGLELQRTVLESQAKMVSQAIELLGKYQGKK